MHANIKVAIGSSIEFQFRLNGVAIPGGTNGLLEIFSSETIPMTLNLLITVNNIGDILTIHNSGSNNINMFQNIPGETPLTITLTKIADL